MLSRLFILLLCLGFLPLRAQLVYSLDDDHAYIAVMEKQLREAPNDSVRGHLQLKLSVLYRLVKDTAKAREARNKGLAIAPRFPFLNAISWFYRAQALYDKMDVVGIETCLMKGDSLLSSMASEPAFEIRASIWHTYATMQQIKGDEKAAMRAFVDKALPFATRSGSAFLIGNTKKGLAMVLMNANQRDKAAHYLTTAADDLSRAAKDIPVRLETLAEIHIAAAENFALSDNLTEAEGELKKAFAIIGAQPRSNLFFGYYFAEAVYLDKKGAYSEAVNAAKKGIRLAEESKSVFWTNRLRHAVYKALNHDGRHKEAARELEKLAAGERVLAADKKIYYNDLYKTWLLAGNKEKAFFWAQNYIHLSDSLYDAKIQSGVIELEKKYNDAEDAKKILALQSERHQAELRSRNHRLLIWLLCAALLLLISILTLLYVLYTSNKKHARRKEQDHQRELFEIQQHQKLAQAHALIQGGEQERGRLARDLHDGLGGMLAAVKMRLSVFNGDTSSSLAADELRRAIQQLDAAVNELRRIARNLMPEALISSDLETAIGDLCASFPSGQTHIDFQAIGLQKTIPAAQQVIIYRLTQELVANALRHASARQILVQCSQNDRRFYLTVEDDGRGFVHTDKGGGIGLLNIRNRVDYLNGQLEIISKPGSGTTVNIEFDVDKFA